MVPPNGAPRNALLKKIDGDELGMPSLATLPNSDLKLPHFIVADAAFPEFLMKPFSGDGLSHDQRIYNYRYQFLICPKKCYTLNKRISRARRVIENVFGILCAKWRLLLKPIETNVENANWIVRAIVVLHNFLIDESKGAYNFSAMADNETEDEHDSKNGSWWKAFTGEPLKAAQNKPQKASNWSNNAKEMRKNLLQYFNSNEGSVDWQQKMI